jgi:hypothetical protein
MAGKLSQTREGREHLETVILGLGFRQAGQLRHGLEAGVFVPLSLGGRKLRGAANLSAGRQLFQHFGFGPPQNEGPHHARQGLAALGVLVAFDRLGEAGAKALPASQ